MKHRRSEVNAPTMDALASIFFSYKLAYIGKDNMETTANQVVKDLSRVFRKFLDDFGVRIEDGKICGLSNSVLLKWSEAMVDYGLAVTTRNKYIVLLNPFLKWAVNRGLLLVDTQPGQDAIYQVLKPARPPKEDAIPEYLRKRKHLTAEEARRFIEEMPGRDRLRNQAIVALFLASGFRAEELCSLNVGDVYGKERGLIYLKRKGGEWKYAEVCDFCYDYIEAYMKTRRDRNDMTAPLFLTNRGTRCNRKQLWKVMHDKEKKLGLASGLHVLRHTFNTEVSAQSSPEIARDLSNHKSLSITNRYIHTTHEQRREAVNRLSWADLSPK